MCLSGMVDVCVLGVDGVGGGAVWVALEDWSRGHMRLGMRIG